MKFKQLRAVGVVGCVIGTGLLVLGGLSDHWVNSDTGHWGLWEICEDETKHNTTNVTHPITTTTASTVTATRRFGGGFGIYTTTMSIDSNEDLDEKDDNDDEKEEEDECLPFYLSSTPAFLHVVRALMVLAVIILAWGVLSGKTLRINIDNRGYTFFQMHKVELFGCVACVGAGLAIYFFSENYKTVKENSFPNRYLDWSFYLVRISLYLYIPGAVLMMAPSLYVKYQDFNFGDLCVSKPHTSTNNVSRLSNIRQRSDLELGHRHDDVDRNSNRTLNDDESHLDMEYGVYGLSRNFQMSETDSDIFTVTFDSGNGGGGNHRAIDGSDLPQYEDVARSGGGGGSLLPLADGDLPHYDDVASSESGVPSAIPPPPSYEEVLTGGFLSFAPSSTLPSSSVPPPPPPPPFPDPSSSAGSISESSSCTSSESSLPTSCDSQTEPSSITRGSRDSHA